MEKWYLNIGENVHAHTYVCFLTGVRISCSDRCKVLRRSVKSLAAAAASMFLGRLLVKQKKQS